MSTDKINGTSNGFHTVGDDKFEEIQIPVPWGHISGKWWGPRACQPVLAIHGWQDNAGTFDPLASMLAARGHSVLCIDLPGHGLSSRLASGHYYYIFWDGVHLVRRLVKHFNWEKVTMMGHSLGGGIAFLYAAVYPDETEKFISLDISGPSVRSPKKMVDATADAVDKFLQYEKLSKHQIPCYKYEEMIDIVHDAYKGAVTRECCKIMMKRGMKEAKDKPGHYLFARDPRLKVSVLGFMSGESVLEFASRIKCDVLNIRASPGLVYDFPEMYDKVLDAIGRGARRLERERVEGTHHLHLNTPEKIVDIVDQFLLG